MSNLHKLEFNYHWLSLFSDGRTTNNKCDIAASDRSVDVEGQPLATNLNASLRQSARKSVTSDLVAIALAVRSEPALFCPRKSVVVIVEPERCESPSNWNRHAASMRLMI